MDSKTFELLVTEARAGNVPMQKLLLSLLEMDLVLPSGSEVQNDGSGFQPLLFNKEGTQMLAAFTDKDYALQYKNIATYCLVMKGKEVLLRIPAGHGLVINPGCDIGFDISPDGIQKILQDFSTS